MSTTYHHGVRVIETTSGSRAIRTISTSVLGLIATANDADNTVFPVNKAVLITDVLGAISKAGNSGTLAKALTAIANQSNPVTVVVRVPEGADESATNTNVIGTAEPEGYTGIQALLTAEIQLGVRPRILGAPGLETQPVVAALAVVAKKLRAMIYARAVANSLTEAVTYRGQFAEREVMLLWPDWLAWNTTTSATAVSHVAAVAMGLRAKIDNEQGWHKSLSNVPVAGVSGISKDVHWDLQTTGTDADLLNEADITTLINYNGYRFWGSRTCANDTSFAFETATRTAQILADTIAEGVASYIDKPLYPSIVRDLLESINAKFRELKTAGYILGAEAYYDSNVNTSQTLSLGQLSIKYDYTPVPPLEDLQLNQSITDSYFDDFAAQINA